MTLTVVGIAQSVSTPDVAAWMSPSDLAAIDPDTAPARQMLYRVEPSATAADLQAAVAAITEGLSPDAVASTYSYLETKVDVDSTASLYVPILLAFSAFALAAAAFTIANIVSGIVLTSYRDIGVMKAIGFTPLQVTSILLAQIMVPAAVGIGAGIVAGLLGSASTVERMARSFGLPGTFSLSIQVVARRRPARDRRVIRGGGPAGDWRWTAQRGPGDQQRDESIRAARRRPVAAARAAAPRGDRRPARRGGRSRPPRPRDDDPRRVARRGRGGDVLARRQRIARARHFADRPQRDEFRPGRAHRCFH